MELLVFIVVAAALYLVADRLLERIEVAKGRRLEHRTLIFFAILLVLALVSFTMLQRFFAG